MILGDVSVKWYREPAYYQNSPWRGTWALDGGGAIMNQSIHFVDLLLWMMGPVRDVAAYAAANLHTYIEVEDMAVASLRFENGALGSIVGTTAAYPGLYDRLSFHGTRGSILVENGRIARWEAPDDPLDAVALEALNRVQMGNAHTPMALDMVPHQRQLEEIFACLKAGVPVKVDGAEARKAVAWCWTCTGAPGRSPDCP